MRKETFTHIAEEYNGLLITYFAEKGIDLHKVQDAVQDAIVSILANKSYTSITSEKQKDGVKFLKGAIWNLLRQHAKQEAFRQEYITNLTTLETPVEDAHDTTDFRERERDESECPFCYKTVKRTKYKDLACPHCNTIVGQGKIYSDHVSVTDEDLVDFTDLDMQLDVQRAMKVLTPIERRIVETFVERNMSLDDLSLIYDIDRFALRRMFQHAKDKLRKELSAYEAV